MKTVGPIRITPVHAPASASASPSAGTTASDDAASIFDAEAMLQESFIGEDGAPRNLQLRFQTDAKGGISNASLAVAGAAQDTEGFCKPICITYGTPPKTRCFFPVGCAPASHPNVALAVEFDSKAIAGTNDRKVNVRLWRQGARKVVAQSSGVLSHSAKKGKNK